MTESQERKFKTIHKHRKSHSRPLVIKKSNLDKIPFQIYHNSKKCFIHKAKKKKKNLKKRQKS